MKGKEAVFLLAQDVEQTLALYKSLKEVGGRVEITPRGVKVDSEAMWALVAVAVERGASDKLPAEVMPGVELLKVYNVGETPLACFLAVLPPKRRALLKRGTSRQKENKETSNPVVQSSLLCTPLSPLGRWPLALGSPSR